MKIIEGGSNLTIQNFDKRISAAMLRKGKQYYKDGAILDIGDSNGSWTAEVEGSDIYDITVTVEKDQELNEYFCSCPYDGDICKHLVAVFFAIREEIKNRPLVLKIDNKKDQFGTFLKKITIEEYRGFVADYSAKNKDFKTIFELYFAEKDDRIDVGKMYSGLIRALIKKFSSRGFIEYRASIALAKEVTKLIYKGHDLANKMNFKDAFTVGIVAMREMMQALTRCDDSSGSIGGTVSDAIELIGEVANSEHTAIDLKEQVFSSLQKELNDKLYFDYGDFGYELFSVYKNLAIEMNKEKNFLDFIEDGLKKFNGGYDDYKRSFFKIQRISFLKAIGKEEDAENLVQQSLDIEEIRQGEVNKALTREDFARAKKLIAEGIKIAETKKHPGTVTQWEKELLRIAVLENDMPLVRWYCKRFAFERWFDEQYYKQWRETFTKAEWPDIIEIFIAETTQKLTQQQSKNKWSVLNSLLLQVLAPVFIQEKYWDRLFELVKNEVGLDAKMQYHSYLVKHYPTELLQLYLPDIAIKADNVNDRGGYANLTGTMKMIIKDIPFGKEKILEMAQNLKAKYPRRPAMVDELNKLLKL